jgi:hypothetical protein
MNYAIFSSFLKIKKLSKYISLKLLRMHLMQQDLHIMVQELETANIPMYAFLVFTQLKLLQQEKVELF